MLSVYRNNTSVMNHLDKNHQVVISLNELIHVVVEHIVHGRTAGGTESDYAAFSQRPALRTIVTPSGVGGAAQVITLLGKRDAPVFGIGDPGGS